MVSIKLSCPINYRIQVILEQLRPVLFIFCQFQFGVFWLINTNHHCYSLFWNSKVSAFIASTYNTLKVYRTEQENNVYVTRHERSFKLSVKLMLLTIQAGTKPLEISSRHRGKKKIREVKKLRARFYIGKFSDVISGSTV